MAPDDRDDISPEDEQPNERSRDFSRRQLLRAGAALPLVLSAGSLLAACGGSSHSDKAKNQAHGDHTDAAHDDTSHGDSSHTDRAHTDRAHVDQGGTHNDTGTHSDSGTHSDTGGYQDHGDARPPHGDTTVRDHRHGDTHSDHVDGNVRDHRHTDTHGDHVDHIDTP